MVTLILYSAQDLCQAMHISEHCLVEIVENGIVEPKGQSFIDWSFDNESFSLVRRAIRIQRDLELDWAATALAISLLNEVDKLRAENNYLKQRLGRLEIADVKLL